MCSPRPLPSRKISARIMRRVRYATSTCGSADPIGRRSQRPHVAYAAASTHSSTLEWSWAIVSARLPRSTSTTCQLVLSRSKKKADARQASFSASDASVKSKSTRMEGRATFAIAVPVTIIRARNEHDHLHPAFRIVGRRFAPIDPVAAVGFFPSLSSHPDRSVRIASAKAHPIQETNRQGTPATHEPATSAARLRAAPPCAF